MTEILECLTCGRTRPLKPNGECFKCWIGDGPGIAWRGGGGTTRQLFHDRTNSQAIAEELAGHDPTREYEPRHTRANSWAPVK